MAGTYNILYGVLLSAVYFPIFLQAQISFPLENVTYWSPGSLVKLPWTYNFPKTQILAVEISFTETGLSMGVTLAEGFQGANATSKHPSKFTIEGQATLVFKNASLSHNGTYALGITIRGGGGYRSSEVKVVILAQPTANVNCASLVTLKEGDDFNCSCEGTDGNPPAIALWYKGNVNISGPGYLQEILSLKNVSRNTVGNYSCSVKSYNLTDSKRVEIQVLPQISFPLGGVTYWQPGSLVKLPWTYNFTTNDILFVSITFIKSGSDNSVALANGTRGANLTALVPSKFTIEGQATLVFKNASLGHNGTYSLAVLLKSNISLKSEVLVVILVQPTAKINCASLVTLKEGDDFNCSCEGTDGNPPAIASWYKGNVIISGPGYLQEILSLKNVSRNTVGNYSCFVKSYNLTDSKQVEIQVLLKPTAVINCSTNVTVKEGDNVECLCYGIGGDPLPTASWSKNGKKVNGSGHLKKTLSLKSILKENAGNYSCIVNNTVFEDVKQIEIKVQYKPINILFQSVNQTKYIAVAGENVTITCKADGVPAPNYIILHNGTPLNTTDVVNGVTTIKSVQRSDDGQYQCIANNFLGNTNTSFNLIVHERPTAEINCSSPFTVKEGDNFKCLCYSSTGYPPPNATWYNRHGNKVGETESLNKTLLLKNITKEEAGNYNCTVKSLDLEDTKQIKLQVQFKPIINSFESNMKNNIATVCENVTITCMVEGFPAPNITILHNGKNITDVGMKNFKSVNIIDGGHYECIANNILGNVSKNFNFTVKEVSTTSPSPTEEVSTTFPRTTKEDSTTIQSSILDLTKDDRLSNGVIVAIAVGYGLMFIVFVVLICYCCKHGKCDRSKKERNESEVVVADGGISNVAVAVEEGLNAYESVDKEKIKPNVEAGTSGDGEPARVDSPPSMPPVYAVVDKKLMKKETSTDEEKPASGKNNNAAPAAGPSTLYVSVDKVAQKKEQNATSASLDPVLLQPDSSKMRDRSREETNSATIDMGNLHSDKI